MKERNLIVVALVILGIILGIAYLTQPTQAQQTAGTNYSAFDAAFAAPKLSGVGSATLTYTAGTLYTGGTSKSITAGTLTSFGATKNNCDAPAFSSCEIVYWNTGTSLLRSATYATAFASGNIPLGFVTTDGSSVILTITPATLAMPPLSVGSFGQVVTGCGTAAACSPTTASSNFRVVYGNAAFSSGTPSAVTITGISPAFTSTSTYQCTASPVGATSAIAAGGAAVSNVSGSSFTITGPATVTTVVNYTCIGN